MTDHTDRESRRIVVGIDGSDGAQRALDWAIGEARAHDAHLDVVSAWTLPADWAQGYNPEREVDLETKARMAATETRAAVEQAFAPDDVPGWVEVHVQEGQPAEMLLERAEGADLLVVGSRGRGGFARMLLGSVSNAVVHHSPCPVVVIPTDRDG